jgi:hypothetical protein
LTEDLKLPTGRRLLTVCLSMKDGERRGLLLCAAPLLLLLLEEDTGVMGMLLLLLVVVVVVEEPVGVGVMSASVGVGRWSGRLDAGMSMERCVRGRWSDDAGFASVGDEVVSYKKDR